jgi:hypothetical protein
MAPLAFRARIFKMGTWFLLEIPFDMKAEWGKGSHRAKGTIDDVPISGLTVRPFKDESGKQIYLLALEAGTRKAIGKGEGDEVGVRIEPDTGQTELPADMAEALQADSTAQAAWDKLTPGRKIALIKHIESAKQADTRRTRIRKAIEDMLAGKAMY